MTLEWLAAEDPSTLCGHHYSKAAIFDFIEKTARSKAKARCPSAGCNQILTKAELKVCELRC
jgi:hypothetical protein